MKVINQTVFGITLLNLLAVIYFGWMLFHPVKLPIIYNEPFPVDKEEVRRGETISYTMIIEKRKQYAVDSHKNIICEDGNLVTLATSNTNIPLGEATFSPEVVVPAKTSLGTCWIEIINDYHINGFRTETVTMLTQPFRVIK